MDDGGKVFIKDLTVRTKKGYLCVRVMRKWNYDGNVPGGRIFYIGLLFADEQGNAIYAQIPENEVQRLGPQLALDQVYTIRRFNVRTSKAGYVPFDAGIMIQITSFTTITPAKVPIELFPKILYQITPFNQIRTSGQATTKYIDVLGVITHEDLPKTACPKGKEYVSTLKEITIKDLSGAHLTVTLWENNVQQFHVKDASADEPPHSVVVLFCGCLPKKIFNKTQVNAGNACRWFFNPEIPEAQPFYDMLKRQPVPIQRMDPVGTSSGPQAVPRVLEHKTVAQLNAINPYDFPEQGCKCTVTITQVPPDQEWWYMGCEVCKKRLRNNGGTYYCTKCDCSIAIPLYKLTFIAADESAEARFFCYDVNARQIIRRNCDSLLRSIQNVSALPEPILRTVGRTFTFSVGLTEQSYNSMSTRAYLVDSCVFRQTLQDSDAATSSAQQLPAPFTPAPLQLTYTDSDASHSKTTPPPQIGDQETPEKEEKNTDVATSQEAQAHHDSVRKRLFPVQSTTKLDTKKGESNIADKKKSASKKPKTLCGTEETRTSSGSKDLKNTPEEDASETDDTEKI